MKFRTKETYIPTATMSPSRTISSVRGGRVGYRTNHQSRKLTYCKVDSFRRWVQRSQAYVTA